MWGHELCKFHFVIFSSPLLEDKKIIGNKWEIACESIDADVSFGQFQGFVFQSAPRSADNNFAKSTFRPDNPEIALRSSLLT